MALDQFLSNPLGLLSLLSILGLLIVYFIYRKPKMMKFPSLVFLRDEQKRADRNRIFQKLNIDLLFWLNLLALIVLSLAVAEPFITTSGVQTNNPVVAIDVSASMKAVGSIDLAKEKAISSLGNLNTVAIYSNSLNLLGDKISRSEAEDLIRGITATDKEDNLENVIRELDSLFPSRSILVISDFRNAKVPQDIIRNNIYFLKVNENLDIQNAGFVGAEIGESEITLKIKNNKKEAQTFSVSDGTAKKELTILPKKIGTVKVLVPQEQREFKLTPQDAFQTDSSFYFVPEQKTKIRALLITDRDQPYISSALEAMPFIEFETAESIKIPEEPFDVYIITEIDKETFIRSNFERMLDRVIDGAMIAVYAWEDIKDIDFDDNLPVRLGQLLGSQRIVSRSLVSDIDFTSLTKHFETEPNNGIDLALTPQNNTIISYKKLGEGTIFYYGIMDKYSDFKQHIHYPVFWKQILQFGSGYQTTKDLNVKTGESFKGTIIDTAGFQTVGATQISGNLLSEHESAFEAPTIKETASNKDNKAKKDITQILVLVVLAALVLELIYAFLRGDFE